MGAVLSSPVDSIVVDRAGCAKLRCAVATMQGWRISHEDSHVMIQPPTSSSANAPFMFSVMDGHGGDEAAAHMEHILPAHVDVATLPAIGDPSIVEALQARFKAADVDLRSKLPVNCTAGATCTSALVCPREGACGQESNTWDVTFANAGDSRSIVIRANGTFVATEDHKPDNPGETARIKAAGGFITDNMGGPFRVDGNLAVSRAFGDFAFKDIKTAAEAQKISCVPEVTTGIQCKDGDFVLLCCDGIFDVMSNEDCVNFVLQHDRSDLGMLVSDLLQLVLEKGSRDNCSAMICQVGEKTVKAHAEDDATQSSTTLHPSKWHGFHTGYGTRMLIPGNVPDGDPNVRQKFAAFHATFGYRDLQPASCSQCECIYQGMQVCSRCRTTQYCSHVCQKLAWKLGHRDLCHKK
eukprot:GEMP01013119.1.p1 GENE.GEMP01013119.1~~GEMP01013119.1.p1  ORF type:complete len:409 (+),score=114.53 GEMP01013119.1:144-1370(+)